MRHARLTPAFAVAALLAVSSRGVSGAATNAVEVGPFTRHLVRVEKTVWNAGSGPLADVSCDMFLPLETYRQRVNWVRLSKQPWTVTADALGNHVASARFGSLAAGSAVTFAWIASVETAPSRALVDVEGRAGRPKRDAAEVADDPMLRVADPAISDLAREARRRAPDGSERARARSALALVHERIRYVRDGAYDPAPDVLRRGSGSCTESTFAFAAACRSMGIPARWLGGTRLRRTTSPFALDIPFHRIAEVAIDGHDWVPAETVGNASPTDASNELGVVPDGFLLLSRVRTTTGPMGTEFRAKARWMGGTGAEAHKEERAWWVAAPDPDGVDVPAYAAAIRSADAEGFGPPSGLDGKPLDVGGGARKAGPAPAVPRGSGSPGGRATGRADLVAARAEYVEAAFGALAMAHPGALRDALRAIRAARQGDQACLVGRLESGCTPTLWGDVKALVASSEAAFETWWEANDERVARSSDGRLDLAPAK